MRTIEADGGETVAEIASRMSVTGSAAITVGLRDLGRLLTLHQELELAEIRELAGQFGFEVRSRGSDAR